MFEINEFVVVIIAAASSVQSKHAVFIKVVKKETRTDLWPCWIFKMIFVFKYGSPEKQVRKNIKSNLNSFLSHVYDLRTVEKSV